jgi:hypothetical protein
MSSNSPSGGMNEMVLSFSNRDNRTHWWNLTSSISIAFPLAAADRSVGAPEHWRLRTSPSALKHDLVVQTKPKFRHTREIAFHLDCTQDL